MDQGRCLSSTYSSSLTRVCRPHASPRESPCRKESGNSHGWLRRAEGSRSAPKVFAEARWQVTREPKTIPRRPEHSLKSCVVFRPKPSSANPRLAFDHDRKNRFRPTSHGLQSFRLTPCGHPKCHFVICDKGKGAWEVLLQGTREIAIDWIDLGCAGQAAAGWHLRQKFASTAEW